MRTATRGWLAYARENLGAASLCLEHGFFNQCLQNVQQCVEKAVKATIIEQGVLPERTHRLSDLLPWIREHTTVRVTLSPDEITRLDSIYIPSKYPVSSAWPDGMPSRALCEGLRDLAARVFAEIESQLAG